MLDYSFDISHKTDKIKIICGVDEAGRGPLAGPVVAAAVCFENLSIPEELASQLNDSKKLSAKKREKLFDLIYNSGALIGVGQASICEWENDLHEPTLNGIKAMAIFFNVSTDFLLGLEDEAGVKIYIKNSFNNFNNTGNFKI